MASHFTIHILINSLHFDETIGMRKRDARSWTAEELQRARDNVVSLVRKTSNKAATARSLGVSRQFVYKWLRVFHTEWEKWRKEKGKKPRIKPRKRGRPRRRGRPPMKERRKAATADESLVQTELYRIGVIAEACGLSRQTIHNYTKMGLIKPTQISKGNHRLYSASATEIVNIHRELKRHF